MGEEHSIKNLVSRTASNPWNAILGRRPGKYQIPEVGQTLMNTIDYAFFERDLEKAMMTCVILEKWAESIEHFSCKAPAVMSTIFTIFGKNDLAEEKIVKARKRIRDCDDCRAHYLRRSSIYFAYNERPQESVEAYTQAIALFRNLGNDLERAKCLIGRGAAKYLTHDYESGLHDQEDGIQLLDADAGHYIVFGVINSAALLTKIGRRDEATKKVEEAQEMLSDFKNAERPKLVLRWIKSLLLEDTGIEKDRKLAMQMIYRVEVRMRNYLMNREIRVLLADRARIARAPHTIQEIAEKALKMEETPRMRSVIREVIGHPSRENILRWRDTLDSYVPPFIEVA